MVYIVVLAMFEAELTLDFTTAHGKYFDPSLATRAAGLATQSTSIHQPGEDEQYTEEAYSHTVWLADDKIEVSILVAPLWYVQTHGIPSTGNAPDFSSAPVAQARPSSPSRYHRKRTDDTTTTSKPTSRPKQEDLNFRPPQSPDNEIHFIATF